jgi:hypothetical protein
MTWPATTARTFVGLVNAERWEDASAMLGPEVDPALLTEFREYLSDRPKRQAERWEVESNPRSWTDLAAGRQRFRIGCYHFSVERGRVVYMQWVVYFTIPFLR